MYVSETEALRAVFSAESRPSLRTFQRMRDKAKLPCYKFGARVVYDLDELETAIKSMKRPEPEA